jgi:carbonic anhydrase
MSAIDELLANNAAYAERFEHGNLPTAPSRKLAVVACMDSRIDVFSVLGLGHGEAHIMRNAGGIMTDDMIRSLVISQHLLGTRSIILIHHTDCGAQKFTDPGLSVTIQERTGYAPPFPLGAFVDLDESVRESLRKLRGSAYLVDSSDARGFVYDVDTGRLREVTGPAPADGTAATSTTTG